MFKTYNLKKIVISILSVILICSVSLFVGCNKSESGSQSESSIPESGELYNPSEDNGKQTLSIDSAREVELGERLKLTVHSTNIDVDLIWSSSDESVATVDENGEITTLSAGQTVITVRAGSLSSSCTLTVCQTSIAPVLFLDIDDVTVGVNSKYTVNVTSVKWNNQEVRVENLNWAYKNEPQEEEDKVVSITPSADGRQVEIEGLKTGEAELTVSCSYFNNLGAKTVKVKVVDLETIQIEGLEYVGNDTYLATTYSEIYTKTVGQTTYNYQDSIDFNVIVYKNGEIIQAQPELTVADATVAKIENGKIFGLKEGETTITCSYNGLERRIRFVCARPEIRLTEQDNSIVDCYESTSIEIAQTDAIQGEINGVYFSNGLGESFVEVGSYTGGVVTLDKERLQTSQIGKGVLKLSEDNIDYVFSCGIYTMVIDSAEKLNKLSEESKKTNGSADIYDGYFVLGESITLPKDYEFNEVATDVSANGQNGFIGIFDGQGYQIDGLSIKNGGMFATMGESAVVKNVSFTNASVKDGGFISSRGAGSIQNLYIRYKDITVSEDCGGFVGTFFVNGIDGNASVSNCVVLTSDATYNSNDKSYKKLFVIGGTTKDAGVYSDVLVTVKTSIKENNVTSSKGKNFKNTNDNYIVEQNKAAVAEKFTTFAKEWDRSYWELDEVAFPRPIYTLSVIEHSWGSLIAGTKATCTESGVSAHKYCEHCSAIAICDELGNVLSVTSNANDLTVLAGHTSLKYENGSLKCNDCSAVCQEFNLNVHDLAGSYVCDNNGIEIDFSSISLSSVASIKIGKEPIEYTVDGSVVTIPYSSFCIGDGRYYFGNKTLSITYNGSEKIDLSILLKTKVIKTVNDLQDLGKISLAQSDNSQITDSKANKYSGYFELGADVDCNGARYTMVANSSQHVSATVNGFSGVFDGKGYTISNLLVGADKMWYSGWDDTPDTCYDTYSFFGRLDGGKICNVNFTGAKLNPMSSLLCSSGYGEISNVYAQITRCAIITDITADGQLAAYFPLSLCFSNGVNGDLAKVSVHDVLVDYLNCEYLGLNKGNEYPYGSGLATYDEFGFVENQKIYSVFGLDSLGYLQNCYVVGYPGQAWNGEILFDTYTDMNVGELGNFNDGMFAIRGNMLLPISLVSVYDRLTSLDVTVDKHIAISGDKIKVDLGDAISFATFVTESDKISFSNGYIKVADDAIGEIAFKFTLKLANGELLESEDIIRVFANEDDVFAVEVESWESEEIGAVKLGSALNSSEAISETLGGYAIYKTGGGYGQSIVNTSVDASNYSELYFAFKADQRVTLSNGDYLTNVITPNVWYVVKLERHVDGTWSIYTKGISDGNYVEFAATTEFFGVNATFDTMFRTYLWIADAMQDNHQVYATDVWGVVSEQYVNVEVLIDSLPSVITTANVNDVFTVYNAYEALNEEQQAKVNAEKLAKLNGSLGQVFALEVATWEDANKVLDSTLNDTATKVGTFGDYDIYSKTGLGAGGNGIGSESIQINDYKEIYFMVKSTYPVSIFSGDWYASKLEVNKWYAIKLVKGEEHWQVYQREMCQDAWTELVLDNYDSLKSTQPVWFNSAFITVTWDGDVSYDVSASGTWGVIEEAYNSVEALIGKLPDVITTANVNDVFTVYNAYEALNEEQQAKVNAEKLAKLNGSLGQVFALEVSSWAGANKVLDNTLNDTATKVGTFGDYDIYSKTGLGTGGNGIGSEGIQINDYKEVYFMVKSTYPVSIFSGDWYAPKLEVNKWYAIKLVKGEEHWQVYQREICQDAWTELVLDNYDSLKSTEPVWFNAAFVTVTWDEGVSYDVFASGTWCVGEEASDIVKALIDELPDVITSADVSAVLSAYNEYYALSADQQAKVDSVRVEKLNNRFAQVIGLEISAWEDERLTNTGLNALANGTPAGTWGDLSISSLINTGTDYIANTNIDSKAFEKLYFAFKTDKQVSLCSADQNVITANTWYFIKLEKQEDGSWTISAKAFGESDYVEMTASSEFFGADTATFITMFRTYSWDGIAYNVYATDVWGKSVIARETTDWESDGAVNLGSALNSSEALSETLGGLTVYKTNGGYGQSIVNKSIDSSNYSRLYFAFKATEAITLSNGNGGVNEVTPNTWYFVKLEKQADGSWTISSKKVGDSDYVALTASEEFFGAGKATFETMFRTYLWTADTFNHEVYATDVWGVSIIGGEIATWENAGAEKLGSALNSNEATGETLGGLTVYKTNGGYGQSIVNKSIDASNYSALYFAFKATQQVTLSNGDYQTNVITPNTWYFVKLEKQSDGSWTISVKKVGDSEYMAWVASNEFFGAGNATFETMFRTYLWTDDTYNHEVYATDVWGVSIVGGEVATWENAGAKNLGSALNSSDATGETLGGLTVYKTNGGYGQSIVNKSIDSSNYSALYFAFKATEAITLSNGNGGVNEITPNTWYFVKLEKQEDGGWTISSKKVGDSDYVALTASEEFFGAGNATFETMFRTYLWTADTFNHEVYATDVWGVSIVGGEIATWENAGAVNLGSAINSSEALSETLGGFTVYKTNGGYGQSIVNTEIDSLNYSALYFAFKTDKDVMLSNGDYGVNMVTPNTWYFVKLEKQADGSWTISSKKVGDSDYVALTASEGSFGAGNATFDSMFKTYLWIADAMENNHEVYATDVWGIAL